MLQAGSRPSLLCYFPAVPLSQQLPELQQAGSHSQLPPVLHAQPFRSQEQSAHLQSLQHEHGVELLAAERVCRAATANGAATKSARMANTVRFMRNLQLRNQGLPKCSEKDRSEHPLVNFSRHKDSPAADCEPSHWHLRQFPRLHATSDQR
jgi:hypothetical protein